MTTDVFTAAHGGFEEGDTTTFPRLLEHCLASGLLALDETQCVCACTAETAQLLGLCHKTILGQPASVLPPSLRAVLDKTFRDGRGLPDHHLILHGGPNKARTLRVVTTPIRHSAGTVTGVIAVLNDVTPARRLEDNLRRLDRLASIGTLSASMAHEIKNALVAIKTFVDLLITKNSESSLADIVGREMRRIESIVSQMLRFGGPAKPTFATIHLHKLLEESLGLVQHHLEGRKIRLIRTFHASSDTLRGDVYQLQQAFLNLFFNALEAMGADGELEVTTQLGSGAPETQAAPFLQVAIRDTGIGIAPENFERLFDPFFTTKPNGTGLGLPITRRIVEEHRGQLSVVSEPGQGATFTLLLPAVNKQP